MLRLKNMKNAAAQKKQQGGAYCEVQSAAKIRVQKDMNDLDITTISKDATIELDDETDIMKFTITIRPSSGYYEKGVFPFEFKMPHDYPMFAPKVRCTKKIYHPNIDLKGNVCLNILRDEWSPVLSISSIVIGLQFLFDDPNPHDPLNKDAAEQLARDASQFARFVQRSLNGGKVGSESFDQCYESRSMGYSGRYTDYY